MKRPHSWSHPEKRVGEVFVSNMSTEQFGVFDWSSKREGSVSFDGEGNQLSFLNWFPVFVRDEELAERGVNLQNLRRSLQEQRQAA